MVKQDATCCPYLQQVSVFSHHHPVLLLYAAGDLGNGT